MKTSNVYKSSTQATLHGTLVNKMSWKAPKWKPSQLKPLAQVHAISHFWVGDRQCAKKRVETTATL